MFAPHRVAGDPKRDAVMNIKRITSRTCVGTGETFDVEDDCANSTCAHRIFHNLRVGTTEIHEKIFFAIDIEKE